MVRFSTHMDVLSSADRKVVDLYLMHCNTIPQTNFSKAEIDTIQFPTRMPLPKAMGHSGARTEKFYSLHLSP